MLSTPLRHHRPTLAAALLLLMTSHLAHGLPTSQIDDVRVSLASGDGSILIPTRVSTPTPATTSTKAPVKKQQQLHRQQQQPISLSAENVIGPLENIADRFLKSETVGVVDSFAAQAIEVFARFVDNAGLAMVNIIDSLPKTIDRVADTVDGMVRTADHLGRDVAVIVTAPARVVLTGLNPNFENTVRRRSSTSSSTSSTSSDSESKSNTAKREDQKKAAGNETQNRRRTLVSRLSRMTGQNSGQTNSLLRLFIPQQQQQRGRSERPRERAVDRFRRRMRNQQSNTIETDLVGSSSVRRPSRTSSTIRSDSKEKTESSRRPNHPLSFLGFGALGTHFRNNNNRNNQNSSSEEREKSVFERNFEASRTQASIDKLEEEFGGFLGRLLGTIYRNADPIDSSLSEGLRRVLGTAPTTPRSSRTRSSSSGDSDGSGGGKTTTSTPAPVQFRLSFDDIDPAPARNSDLALA